MADNNIWMINLNSPIYSTLLQNKFIVPPTKQDLVAMVHGEFGPASGVALGGPHRI